MGFRGICYANLIWFAMKHFVVLPLCYFLAGATNRESSHLLDQRNNIPKVLCCFCLQNCLKVGSLIFKSECQPIGTDIRQ